MGFAKYSLAIVALLDCVASCAKAQLVGRLAETYRQPCYVASVASDLEPYVTVEYLRSFYGFLADDHDAKIASAKSAIDKYIGSGKIIAIPFGTRVKRISHYTDNLDYSHKFYPQDYYRVEILEGKNKGFIGWSLRFDDFQPVNDEPCILTSDTVAAFDSDQLGEFLERIDEGNDKAVRGMLILGEIFLVSKGDTGVVYEGAGRGRIRVRFETGKGKGKLGWVRFSFLRAKTQINPTRQ